MLQVPYMCPPNVQKIATLALFVTSRTGKPLKAHGQENSYGKYGKSVR